MIRAEATEHGIVLVADMRPGSLAYVDRDWLSAPSDAVPSVVVSRDGTVTWCNGPAVQGPTSFDPDTTAALVFLAVAREAAGAVEGLAPVQVFGSGLIARRVRALLGAAVWGENEPVSPAAIVEATGDPTPVLDATRRVADLGTVALVGECLERGLDMNLYPDVHVRGLTLSGVAPPLQHVGPLRAQAEERPAVEWCREYLDRVTSGAVLSLSAAWYAVDA